MPFGELWWTQCACEVTEAMSFSKHLLPSKEHWPLKHWACVTLHNSDKAPLCGFVGGDWVGALFSIFREANLDSLKMNVIFEYSQNSITSKPENKVEEYIGSFFPQKQEVK